MHKKVDVVIQSGVLDVKVDVWFNVNIAAKAHARNRRSAGRARNRHNAGHARVHAKVLVKNHHNAENAKIATNADAASMENVDLVNLIKVVQAPANHLAKLERKQTPRQACLLQLQSHQASRVATQF
jgi:hypothetical protein